MIQSFLLFFITYYLLFLIYRSNYNRIKLLLLLIYHILINLLYNQKISYNKFRLKIKKIDDVILTYFVYACFLHEGF